MNDKVIIITGGSSGIGKGIARKFAAEGARVVISGRNLEKLEKAKQEIEKTKGQILCIQMDVRNLADVETMVQRTIEKFGRIDYLVNNAAGNFIAPAEDITVNGWNSVVDIVLNGTWYCTQTVGKEWIKTQHKGSILNIVSTYAWMSAPGTVHSAAAKAGVLSMTKTLAVEWGRKYGIKVNAIAPGPIENTGAADRLWKEESKAKEIINNIPLQRLGQVEEIADIVYFLLSAPAGYINGECLTIDGGQWIDNDILKVQKV